jgi:acetolactate decarboxylase
MIKLLLPVTILFLLSCSSDKQDMIFHYSVLKALDNGVLEGNITTGELKKHGDLGLGTFNKMDGEMVVLDHVVYRISPEGKIIQPGDETLIPYSVVTFFDQDGSLSMEGEINYGSLKEFAADKLPSQNLFYAIRITGEFENIKCGGSSAQEKPYDESLREMLSDRPVYEAGNIRGTLVGFWCPAYIGDINTSGFHLHFISDDHSIGGHLMEFNARSLQLAYDIKTDYRILLPETDMFKSGTFRSESVDY